jgi:hypothetical protein
MDACNEAEDEEHGDDDGSGGLPAELRDRQRRVEKLRAVREQLEAERGAGAPETAALVLARSS